MRTLAATLLCSFLLACGNPSTAVTPAPPNSAQTAVANINKTLADADNTAVKLAIALRNAGTLTQANTAVIETWCKSVQVLDDAIATELGSADVWATQKQKILLLVAGFAGPKIIGAIDPGLSGDLAAVSTLLTSIQAQVTN